MCATIYDVHHRNRENVCVSTANVTVKRDIESLCSRLSYSKRYAENGICTEFALCRSAVESKHLIVDGTLVEHAIAFECGSDYVVYIVNSLGYALSAKAVLVAVAKFESFVAMA